MPQTSPPPAGWDRISRTTENPLSVMTLYGLLGLKHFTWGDGQEWPPRLPDAPDPILYADLKSIEVEPSGVKAIPPQALAGAFLAPPPSIHFKDAAQTGGAIGPVRLKIVCDSIDSDGNRTTILDKTAEVLSPSLVGGASPDMLMPASELDKMKALLAAPSAQWSVEVRVAVQCAQPYKNPNPLRRQADWFWIETARAVRSIQYDLLKPEFVALGERLMAQVADASAAAGMAMVEVKQASADAAAAMAGASAAQAGLAGVQAGLGQVQQDVVALKGDLLARIQDFKIALPPLIDFYVQQGIKDSIQGFVTQTDLDGIIKGIAVEHQADIDKLHDELAFQGAAMRQMVGDEVYSVREDIQATDGRVEALRNLLFSEIRPLKQAIGEQLTREDVEKIVEAKIAALRASLTPPVPRAFLVKVDGPATLATPGAAASLTATLNVIDAGVYSLDGFFVEQRLTPGTYSFQASRTVNQAGAYSEKHILHGKGPDGQWGELGAATWNVYVAPLLAPTTGDPPDLSLDWLAPQAVPAGVAFAPPPAIWVILSHPQSSPGPGFSYGYSILFNQKAQVTRWGGLTTGRWPEVVSLDLSSVSLPDRNQQVVVDAMTVIVDSSGNIWGTPKKFRFVYPYSVVYPLPKVAGALRPPLEAAPGSQFPVIVTWDNASGVPGVIRVGGSEVNAPAGPSSIALVGSFPDADIAYADVTIPVSVKGPGGVWEGTDSVTFRTFRKPPTAVLSEVDMPLEAVKGGDLDVSATFIVGGLPASKSAPVRLILGSDLLASGSITGNGVKSVSGTIRMPERDLLGTAKLQVYDSERGAGPAWLTMDTRFVFVRLRAPLPLVAVNFPPTVAAGEPVLGSVSFQNIGAGGRVVGRFMQSQVFDDTLAPGSSAVVQAQLGTPMWDDGRLVAQATGGREVAISDALVSVVFPHAEVTEIDSPERRRPGQPYRVVAHLVNRGALGRVGLTLNGVRQEERVGESAERSFIFDRQMPGRERDSLEAVAFDVGRLRQDVTRGSWHGVVEAKEAAFVSPEGLRLYGAPGMVVAGVAVAEQVSASGWSLPLDGQAAPATLFVARFSEYGPAVLEAKGLQFLRFEVLPGSSVGDVAVVESGVLVESAARRYTWNSITSKAMAPARGLLALEQALGAPSVMRRAASLGQGLFGPVGAPNAALPLLRQLRQMKGQGG